MEYSWWVIGLLVTWRGSSLTHVALASSPPNSHEEGTAQELPSGDVYHLVNDNTGALYYYLEDRMVKPQFATKMATAANKGMLHIRMILMLYLG